MRTVTAILIGWSVLMGVPVNVGATIRVLGIISALWEVIAGALSFGLFLWILLRYRSATRALMAAAPTSFAIWSRVAWGVAGAANTLVTYLLQSGRVDRFAVTAALLTCVLLGTTGFDGTRIIAERVIPSPSDHAV
jgi:hypothetical protein